MNVLRHMSQLDPSKIHGLGLGAIVVLSLLGSLLGLRPLTRQHDHTVAQRQELASTSQRAEAHGREEEAISQELKRIRSSLAASSLTLRTAADRNVRLARLTELAETHRLEVDGLTSSAIKHDEHYDMVPIELRGKGSFPDCAAFIHRLNSQFRDMSVNALEINGTPGLETAQVGFRFEMTWYAAPTLAWGETTP